MSDDPQMNQKRAAKHVQGTTLSPMVKGLIVAAVLLVSLGVVVAFLTRGATVAPKPVTRAVPSVAATGTAGLPFAEGAWVMMTLSDGQVYFGRLTEPATGFVALWNVYYPSSAAASSDQSATVLTKLGTELHHPKDYLIVNRSAITAIQGLTSKSTVLAAITKGDSGSARPDLTVKAPLSAVFLTGGRVVFGSASVSDEWFSIARPHYLARKSGGSSANAPIKSLDDLQLVPEADARIGLRDTMFVPISEVLFYEALDPASPVVKALAKSASASATPTP